MFMYSFIVALMLTTYITGHPLCQDKKNKIGPNYSYISKPSVATSPIPTPTATSKPCAKKITPSVTMTQDIKPTPSLVSTRPSITYPSAFVVPFQLNNDIKNSILSEHANERALSNLTSLRWDNRLQKSAQEWSNTLAERECRLEHLLSSFAQNLYAGFGWTSPQMKDAVRAWIDEKLLLDKEGVTYPEVGHYLIVVNKAITQVGCASAINYLQNCFVITCDYN